MNKFMAEHLDLITKPFISDEKQLLLLVPKGLKKNAQHLLEEFDKRGNELTWNSSGTIFVDQVAVPGSNLFTLFPLLFKVRRSEKLIGLNELIQKINDMGLSSYIVNENKLKRKLIDKDQESKKITKGAGESDEFPWYYLGP
jgi:hypothetical protein